MKKLSRLGLILMLCVMFVITNSIFANGPVTASMGVVGGIATDQIGSSGQGVFELPSGNIVITSSQWNGTRGAVTCLTRAEFEAGNYVVSAANSLVGSNASDFVGNGGITILTNGNYVVRSSNWANGAALRAGAVTWVNGSTCIPANESTRGVAVSATNSLVGTTTDDLIGNTSVIALTNGNYVVGSQSWNNGAITTAGAVTWGNGATGITGPVTTTNSLVGTTIADGVGTFLIALTNGNYVVRSFFWNNGAAIDAGAATWGNGATGITGAVTPANSLVGSTTNDRVGGGSVTALTNGNYVVATLNWSNGPIINTGAVTWANGTTGITGPVTTANSLHGSTINDNVGFSVTALTNGNYVVRSSNWDNGAIVDAGAVTWGNGLGGTVGAVSPANSLVGSTLNDQISNVGITALTNGNYVVSSRTWDNGATQDVGAVTWGNGAGGTVGAVSPANSLIGSTAGDNIGNIAVTALTNGNYVVSSANWDDGATANVGAVTWGNGATGIVGAVSLANSLVGSTANDLVGNSGVTALTNGNYVVRSTLWDNGATANVGAVTWGNGLGGTVGIVSPANSLVGSTATDLVGNTFVIALTNGNYVVSSLGWDNGAVTDVGAVTWGNGLGGTVGIVSPANSLVGITSNDSIGNGLVVLTNGNYVVRSANWDNGAITNVGAVTWGDGTTGITGIITSTNSYVGTTASDQIGNNATIALADGNFTFGSRFWDNGATADVGIVAYGTPPQPPITVELSASVGNGAEGNSGTNPISSITLIVSGGISASGRTIELALTDGTATLANTDYAQSNITITIPAGDYTLPTAVNIPVTALGIVGDTTVEPNETLTLTLQNAGADVVIGDANGDATTINTAVYTIDNDDTASVTLNSVSLVEGNAGTTNFVFTATLNNAVAGGFTVNFTTNDGTATIANNDYVATSGTLTFVGTAGETQLITVLVNGDLAVEPNETFTVSLNTVSNASVDITSVGTGTIQNDDVAGVTVSPLLATIVEGGNTTYTVVLNSQPTADVSIAISTLSAETTISATPPLPLVFTTGNWNVAQTVTLDVADNVLVDGTRTATITHTATSADVNYNGITIVDYVLTINDNDSAGVTVSPLLATIVEGGNTTYTVVLNSQPTADVTIAISTLSAETTISATPPLPLVFTTVNWNVAQTVTLDVADNLLVDGTRTATITHTATSADVNYNGITIVDYVLTINDNDSAGVTINPALATIVEGGNTTYTVVLNSQPTADVTVAISTLSAETTISATPPLPLVFTTGNWNIPQNVTLDVADNVLVDGTRTATITHTATSADVNYNGITIVDYVLTINDNDSAGVTVSPLLATIVEGGNTTYTVVLNSQPTADVTIAISTLSAETTISATPPLPLVFTTGNWNVAQTVTLDVADNIIVDGTRTATITHTATSADVNYNGITIVDYVLTINDNDVVGVTINPALATIVEGGNTTYTVVLNSQPTADVTIAISTLSAETTISATPPLPLVFTTVNWNIPQNVTLDVADNLLVDGTRTATITHTATSADVNYNGITIVDYVLTINDNDSAGVTINPALATIVEGGNTTYTVVLNSQPTGDVTIAISTLSAETTISATPPLPLVFTTVNWNIPQNVTLDVADNVLVDGTRTATITHTATSADVNYNGITIVDYVLTINDNDSAGVTINPALATIVEGGNTTYTVVLNSQPTADVTIAISTLSAETTISATPPLPLVFTTGNWNVAQTVTLDVADNLLVDGTRTATITHTATSADANYNGITIVDYVLTINDNDSVVVTTEEPNINVFDPAISKIGVLLPGDLGLTGERLDWIVTVTNTGNATGNNVVVTDTLRSELRVDGVVTSKGTGVISGQTVTVTIGDLAPGEVVTITIQTTVLDSDVVIDNSACVNSSNASTECVTSDNIQTLDVRALPATGETPFWRDWLIVAGMVMSVVMGMGIIRLKRRTA